MNPVFLLGPVLFSREGHYPCDPGILFRLSDMGKKEAKKRKITDFNVQGAGGLSKID